MTKILRDTVAILALTGLLALTLEGVVRLGCGALGRPTITRTERFFDEVRPLLAGYRSHPFTLTAARPGVRVVGAGREVVFNSTGYRSPERSFGKAPGSVRVVCLGGSTTFDIGAKDNSVTWPALLEADLGTRSQADIEVWNAGLPSWTTVESLISLALRDGDLAPDIVLVYHGINDLQPISHTPFDREYNEGHAAATRLAMGLELPRLRLLDRSLLLEWLRDWRGPPADPWSRLKAPAAGPRRGDLAPEGVATFERNVRSTIALAHTRGSTVVLVTQVVRVREATREADLDYLAGWIQGLEPSAAATQLERLNEVVRRQAGPGVVVADAAREIGWSDDDFLDPMHTSEAGSRKLAEHLAPVVARLLDQPAVEQGPAASVSFRESPPSPP